MIARILIAVLAVLLIWGLTPQTHLIWPLLTGYLMALLFWSERR